MYRDCVERVKTILTQAALTYLLLCVLIGGRDHSHIDALRLIRSDTSNFALLKRTQQLNLKSQTGFRNLVKKDRPPIRFLPQTSAVHRRARERATNMTEKLRLNKLRRQGSAVNRHEGFVRARTTAMDCFG